MADGGVGWMDESSVPADGCGEGGIQEKKFLRGLAPACGAHSGC